MLTSISIITMQLIMNLLEEFYEIKYGYFIKLCQSSNINYENYVDPINMLKYEKYNVGEFVDFHIIKHNGKIMCINHEPIIVHPCQISLMKIHYKSFDNNFDYTPTSKELITEKYLEALKENAKHIIEEIMLSINFEDDINYKYESKIFYKEEIKKKESDTDLLFFMNNFLFYLRNSYTTTNFNKMYLFSYYNFNNIKTRPEFSLMFANGLTGREINVKNNCIKNVLNSTHINYNSIEGNTLNNCIKLLNIITKLKYKLIFNDIQRDELLKTFPFI